MSAPHFTVDVIEYLQFGGGDGAWSDRAPAWRTAPDSLTLLKGAATSWGTPQAVQKRDSFNLVHRKSNTATTQQSEFRTILRKKRERSNSLVMPHFYSSFLGPRIQRFSFLAHLSDYLNAIRTILQSRILLRDQQNRYNRTPIGPQALDSLAFFRTKTCFNLRLEWETVPRNLNNVIMAGKKQKADTAKDVKAAAQGDGQRLNPKRAAV